MPEKRLRDITKEELDRLRVDIWERFQWLYEIKDASIPDDLINEAFKDLNRIGENYDEKRLRKIINEKVKSVQRERNKELSKLIDKYLNKRTDEDQNITEFDQLKKRINREFHWLYKIQDAPSPNDFLHEAIQDVLEGMRVCISPFNACLFQIVKGKVYNYYRRRKLLNVVSIEEEVTPDNPQGNNPQTQLESLEMRKKILSFVRSLENKSSMTFRLNETNLVRLKEEGLPGNIIIKLEPLKNHKKNLKKRDFENVLQKAAGTKPTIQYKSLVLIYANKSLLSEIIEYSLFFLDGDIKKTQEIADGLGEDDEEINNAKKRLRRRFESESKRKHNFSDILWKLVGEIKNSIIKKISTTD